MLAFIFFEDPISLFFKFNIAFQVSPGIIDGVGKLVGNTWSLRTRDHPDPEEHAVS